jgi:hypothetical protein
MKYIGIILAKICVWSDQLSGVGFIWMPAPGNEFPGLSRRTGLCVCNAWSVTPACRMLFPFVFPHWSCWNVDRLGELDGTEACPVATDLIYVGSVEVEKESMPWPIDFSLCITLAWRLPAWHCLLIYPCWARSHSRLMRFGKKRYLHKRSSLLSLIKSRNLRSEITI